LKESFNRYIQPFSLFQTITELQQHHLIKSNMRMMKIPSLDNRKSSENHHHRFNIPRRYWQQCGVLVKAPAVQQAWREQQQWN